MHCDSLTQAVMAKRVLNCQLSVKNCSAEFHVNQTEGLVADTRLQTNGHDLHVWRCSVYCLLKTRKKITVSFVTCVHP
jgi:hypothetical protein